MLKEIQKELQTQNNRATKDPIFIVYDWEKVPSNVDYTDKWVFTDSEDGHTIGGTKEDLLVHIRDCGMDEPVSKDLKSMDAEDLLRWLNNNGYDYIDKHHYIEKEVFKGIFFTEKAANSFIAQNKHHFSSKVYTYVESLYRNPEMQYIRECLEKGSFIEQNNKEDAIKHMLELIQTFEISPEELGMEK